MLLSTRDGRPLAASAATPADWAAIYPVIRYVIDHEDSHCIDPSHDEDTLRRIWFAPSNHVYKVTLGDGTLVATFFLRANFDGRGRHIGNGSYMVHYEHRGLGIGQAMGEFSLAEARRLGFTALQYNSVVSTNERALNLWFGLGFQIVGTIPQAYHHRTHGYVDTHILFRTL